MGRFMLMLAASACVLAALSAPTTVTAAVTCGLGDLDLGTLASGADIQGTDVDPTSKYQYYMAVCGSLKSQPLCTQQLPSSNCQVSPASAGTLTAAFDTGNWAAGTPMAFIDATKKEGLTYTLTGAVACWVGASTKAYTTVVNMPCATTAGPLVVSGTKQGCVHTYNYPTPLTCVGGSNVPVKKGKGSAKISGGWVMIIILVILIPLYIGIGCVYKSQKLGATGMDKCPNVEFWRDLPGLVKDGFGFVGSKLCGRGGGSSGGGGGNGSYETM